VVAVILTMAPLAGCLTADGTLGADGTGTLSLGYGVLPGTTEASQRERLKAEGVTVESLTVSGDRVSAKLGVSDLAGLGKTALLKDTIVSTSDDANVRTLKIAVRTPDPAPKVSDKTKPGPKIRLTLPGKVLDANEQGVVADRTVQWTFTLADWVGKSAWELRVRFEAPPRIEQPAATAG
jgi:hypothetical protein